MWEKIDQRKVLQTCLEFATERARAIHMRLLADLESNFVRLCIFASQKPARTGIGIAMQKHTRTAIPLRNTNACSNKHFEPCLHGKRQAAQMYSPDKHYRWQAARRRCLSNRSERQVTWPPCVKYRCCRGDKTAEALRTYTRSNTLATFCANERTSRVTLGRDG